jgi:hypothetical protein
MCIADTLSRAYLPVADGDNELADDLDVIVHSVLHEFPASYNKLDQIRQQTVKDEQLSKLKLYVRNGFPEIPADCPQSCRNTEESHRTFTRWTVYYLYTAR